MKRRTFGRVPLLAAAIGFGLTTVLPTDAQSQGGGGPRLNRSVELLEAGEVVFGIINSNQSLANARALARSGLDFIFIDMEHGTWNPDELFAFLLGMTDKSALLEKGHLQMGVTPIVRIPPNGGEMIQFFTKQALDLGVFGVMFPFVSNREETLNAIASMRYPRPQNSPIRDPHGLRGRGGGPHSWYWGIGGGEYYAKADVWPLNPEGELLAVIQIETREGVEKIEEIVTTAGVGAIFIGPLDLATQMGYGDNPGAPEVQQAIATILQSCLRHNVPCGLTTGAGDVQARIQEGFRIVTVGGDGGLPGGTERALQIGRETAGRQ
jgi:4-hydroxy-2-oxoheptanedioate aldolase